MMEFKITVIRKDNGASVLTKYKELEDIFTPKAVIMILKGYTKTLEVQLEEEKDKK